jgi:hypothetical protein
LSSDTVVGEAYDFGVTVNEVSTVHIDALNATGSFLAIQLTSQKGIPVFNLKAQESFRGICEGVLGRLVSDVQVAFGGFKRDGIVKEDEANLLVVWTNRKHVNGTKEHFRGKVHVQRICDELTLQIREMLKTQPELWLKLIENVASKATEQYSRESNRMTLRS